MPTPDLNVSGLCVFISAGAGGAGRVIAETFADAGARVLTCDLDARAVAPLAPRGPTLRSSKET